jgi:hypothetical protein
VGKGVGKGEWTLSSALLTSRWHGLIPFSRKTRISGRALVKCLVEATDCFKEIDSLETIN